jgi:hypothetical protein
LPTILTFLVDKLLDSRTILESTARGTLLRLPGISGKPHHQQPGNFRVYINLIEFSMSLPEFPGDLTINLQTKLPKKKKTI